jgi:uncharacterized repeat protein (TIGR01451 family)
MKTLTIVFLLVCAALAVVLKTDAQPVTTIYSFINGPAKPLAGLTLGNDGNFYGTTESGGLNNEGTAFKMTTNGITTTLVNFGTTYGSPTYPEANLTLGPDGNFYGTTSQGGTNTSGTNATGTVFKMTTNGTVTILVSFNGVNGGIPLAGLTLAPDGNFYGTTEFGGTNGDGTVFKLTTNGTLTTLVNFNGTNGANPLAGLVAGPGGNLYGTTRYGGTNQNLGTVFQVTTNGTFTTLIQFAGTNGAWPYGGVTVGPDGNLYGTTTWAGNPNGDFNGGTIFELTTNGLLTTLIRFVDLGGTNGLNPETSLTLGPDGNFYGTTFAGGANGNGTVFQVTTNGILATLTQAGIPFQTLFTPQGYEYYTTNNWVTSAKVSNGTLTTLYSFSAQTNGNNPDGANLQSTLALGPDGNFYGTAPAGGANGYGTAFKVTTNGTFTTLATFSGNHGDNLMDALTTGPDGSLYGTANTGGTSGYGTVFKLTTGGALTTLVNFDRANDGANPQAGLIVGPGGNFYGTAVGGGTNLLQTGPNSYNAESFGTVFELTTNGIFTPLAYFSGTNGANPYGGLAFGLDGNLYGTTTYGGISNNGVVFQLLTNGTLTALTNFTGANGANPFASLTLGPDGNFYGTCEAGGTNNDGTVFQVTTNGALTTLVNFNGTNGANPNAGLLLGPDGNFYGTAYFGGARNEGTVFKVTTGGTLTTLVNFAQTNGEFPVGGLALGPDGNFYGTTELGGTLPSSGTVFKLATNGVLTTLYGFVFSSTSPNGNYPFAGLTLVTNGNFIHFYGTTYEGPNGPSGGGGTIFRVNLTTAYAMPENSTNTFFPLTNEVAWTTGGTLSLVNAAATNGTGQITGSGIVFKPTANFIGTATINYAVTNNAGGTNVSLITVLVTNVPPVANPDVYTVAENSSANVLSPLTNDVTETSGGVLSLVSVSPTNGTAVISGTNVLFTPQANFTGTATIGYTITDNVGGTNSSLITVTVTVANSISVVTITAPTSGQVVSNAAFTVTGTAAITGNPLATLTNVYVQLNNGGWAGATSANGWSNWTANVTLTAGSNTVSAYAVDAYGNVSPTNSVTFDYVTNSGALFAGPPGTPASNYNNPGGTVLAFPIGGGIGVQSVTNTVFFSANTTVLAGDVVFLRNPINGNNPTNWAAVLRFINPADPTGTNGLAATEYETYFQTNASPNSFAGFSLLPNVDYLPIASTNADGSITADAVVFGPVGAIISGQEAIIVYTASIQPSAGADLSLSASAAPEPVGVGSNLVYSLTVSNAGPSTATGVVVSNQLPASVTFVSATGGATPTNGVLLVNLGSLAEGTNTSVQVVMQPTAAGQFTNTFQVFANEFDPNLTNNSASVVSTVTNAPILGSAVPGTPVTWNSQGLSPIQVNEGTGVGVNPLELISPQILGNSTMTTLPGDVVFLTDPNGGTNTSNWTAVLNFFNPGDTNGTQGLVATEYQTFFPTNAGPNAFANFPLFPNVIYVPIAMTNADGSVTARTNVFGPVAGVATNQQVILQYTASIQPTVKSSGTNADLALLVNNSPALVNLEQNLIYYLIVSNAGPATATDIIVSNRIPSNATFFSSFTNSVPTNGVLLMNLGSLAPGERAGFRIFIQPTATGPLTNVFQVYADQNDPALTNNTLQTVTLVTNPPPSLIPGTPYAGSWLTSFDFGAATIYLSETVGSGVQPFAVNGQPTPYAVPGDFVMLLDPTGGNSRTNWAAVARFLNPADPAGTNGLLATMQSAFFPTDFGPAGFANFKLFPNVYYSTAQSDTPAPGDFTGVYVEVGPVAGLMAGQTGVISVTVTNGNADLSLVASAAPEPVGVGSNLVYSIAITNQGPNAATGVTVSNQLPANVTFVSATGGATPSSGVLLLNVGSLTNGAVTNVQVIVQTTAAGKLTNQFQVFANEFDPMLANNSASVVSTVTNAVVVSADLRLIASASPEPVTVGSNLVYSIAITNRGPSAASGVIVSNRIPANVNFVSATGGSTPSGGILLINLGSLAAGATNSVQVIVQPAVAGKLTNLFQVFANEFDPVLTNNVATVVSTVTNAPPVPVDVALSLTAAPNPVGVGAPLTYSLTVTNNSSTTATGVVVSNTLPPNVTVFSLLPSQGAATNQSGVVTYSVGSLPNDSAATLAIVVIPNAAGLLTNTASAFSLQTDSQPTNNYATNVTTAVSVPITNLVLTVLSAITLNPQTGLFEERIEVSNGGPATPSSVLVLISGLAANVKVYNATGTTNGLPYVQSSSPLGIGSNVVFLLEYYVPTRVAPTNLTYTVEAGPIVIPPVVTGTILSISRMIKLDNGSVLVEFSAVPGQVYAVQYSSDMVTWLTAVPAITAPANQVQWIDSGPPKTVSSPAQQGARYYRVVLLTAH